MPRRRSPHSCRPSPRCRAAAKRRWQTCARCACRPRSEPVNVTPATPGCSISAAPSLAARAGDVVETRRAARRPRATRSHQQPRAPGASALAALNTTVLPATSAAPVGPPASANGKLNGAITSPKPYGLSTRAVAADESCAAGRPGNRLHESLVGFHLVAIPGESGRRSPAPRPAPPSGSCRLPARARRDLVDALFDQRRSAPQHGDALGPRSGRPRRKRGARGASTAAAHVVAIARCERARARGACRSGSAPRSPLAAHGLCRRSTSDASRPDVPRTRASALSNLACKCRRRIEHGRVGKLELSRVRHDRSSSAKAWMVVPRQARQTAHLLSVPMRGD